MESGETDGEYDYELLDFDMNNVWVLGRDDIDVGKCIRWDAKELPNFLDCECLIVDLTTLDKETLSRIPLNIQDNLKKQLRGRFNHRLMIICILSPVGDYNPSLDMLFWCPVSFSVEFVAPATNKYSYDFDLYDQYMYKVDKWNMVLKPQDSVKVHGCSRSANRDLIGAVFSNKYNKEETSGDLVVLPPLQDSASSIHSVMEFFNTDETDDSE